MKTCEKCGIVNSDDAMFCSACGAPLAQAPAAEPVAAPVEPEAPAAEPVVETVEAQPAYEAPAAETYAVPTAEPAPVADAYTVPAAPAEKNTATLWLILNIVLTVVCCPFSFIFSVIGIIFAAIGMGSYNKGDYADMASKTKTSKIMFIVGLVVAVVVWIICIISGVLGTLGIWNSYGIS